MQSFVHDSPTTSGNEETFLQDFLVILKRKKCLDTDYIILETLS